MKRAVSFLIGLSILSVVMVGSLFYGAARLDAQQRTPVPNIPLNDAMGQFWSLKTVDDGSGNQEIAVVCSSGCAGSGGSSSNASDAVATSSTNGQTLAWLYGFNGTTWDRLRDDGNKYLYVDCAVGCAGGSFNNNADAVATSNTNGQSAAWLYGFNGTTWDRIRDDSNKYLYVDLGTALPAGSAIIGKVGIDQTTPGTTNAVQATNLPSTVTTNAGNADASTLRVAIVSNEAWTPVLGAGSAIIGKIGIDQTTPGTTNAVSLAQIGSVTVSTGAGATGTGTQRVGVAQDTTTIAGSAPGTAGSASANVVSVQGIASMTPFLENPGTAANWGIGATGSAPPANALYNGVSSGGNLTGVVGCNSHTFAHITSATDTLLVQGVSAQSVKICGVKASFSGSAAQSVYVENTASTNANCSSTKTQIGPLITGNSSAPYSDGFYNPIWGGFSNTSGNGVCVNSSGTGGVDVEMWYTQGS